MPSSRLLVLSLLMLLPVPVLADEPGLEFFEKKIRPLLTDNCFSCHSDKKQKGGLRLDSRAALLKGGDTGSALVPANPDSTPLIHVVRYTGDIKMPPKGKLSEEAIGDLTAWVKMGAPWPAEDAKLTGPAKVFDLAERAKYWSFQPLRNPPMPKVNHAEWVRTPVDAFILAKLEAAQLAPAPRTDKRTWIRRVTYDLIGLPPTVEEISAFLADERPDAYATVVDRLLKSPHYGERWARHWLDLVRFAETAGHEFDFEMPEAYRYRDYLIRALNADVPYDQFVREHLAGDMLPQPRLHPQDRSNESILATGFWFLGESKHSPVDIRLDEADRVDNQIDVFGKTFLGLTIACARCHDHKFDAITTQDYYSIAGFLQSSRYQLAEFDSPTPIREQINALMAIRTQQDQDARPATVEKMRALLDDQAWATRLAKGREQTPLGKILRGEKPTIPKIAPAAHHRTIATFDASTYGDWSNSGEAFGTRPTQSGDMSFASDHLLSPGVVHSGRIAPRLRGVLRSPTFRIDFENLHYLAAGRNGQINLIIDGFQQIRNPIYGGLTLGINHGDDYRWVSQNVGMWKGHMAYIELIDANDGYLAVDEIVAGNQAPALPQPTYLTSVVEAAEPLALLRDRMRQAVTRWEKGELPALPAGIEDVEYVDVLMRSVGGFAVAQLERDRLAGMLPISRRAMAMIDGSPENEHVHIRGNHKSLGVEVPRRFLEAFTGKEPIAGSGQSSGRLALADAVLNDNPLAARVIVNRLWHHHFGRGIVASTDDFGVQGQAPTHPELLDYLTSDFVRNGWSLKRLHREMVLSNTYAMSSQLNDKSEARDPGNRLWHRMGVRRLEAEAIRDSLLAVSGRLNPTQEGRGPMPYLTPFMVGRGRPGGSGPLDGDGRRSVYLNVRRNFLNPMFLAFDYPTPFSSMGRRSVSNVPAQALAMMNNPLVIQQANLWGGRIAKETTKTPTERIIAMYEAGLARLPRESEQNDALAFVESLVKDYGSVDDPRVWSDFAHVLMNLKEWIYLP